MADEGFLHPDLFADPRVRSTITGGYLVDAIEGEWHICKALGSGWIAYCGRLRVEHDDVNELVKSILAGAA